MSVIYAADCAWLAIKTDVATSSVVALQVETLVSLQVWPKHFETVA